MYKINNAGEMTNFEIAATITLDSMDMLSDFGDFKK